MTSELGPDCHDARGRLRRLAEQCQTCILRPGNPADLRPNRLRQFVNRARRADTFVVCHETILPASDSGAAACRGYWDAFGGGQLGRIMERLNGVIDVPAPER